jgi:uroporphyrinogen decarboxylase
MTSRDRVLATFRFEQPDRPASDLMEQQVWPELLRYFEQEHGLQDLWEILAFLETDFRWAWMQYSGPAQPPPAEGLPEGWGGTYADSLYERRLARAETVADVEAHPWPDPAWWSPPNLAAFRAQWPDHALVISPGWMPLFCSACDAFGMENTLVKMALQPAVIEAFVRRQHAFYVDILARTLQAARGHCDICWLGDDYASQDALLMGPERWRRFIKPYLAEQVRLVREHGLLSLLHSCGAIRAIIPDLIEIGVDGLLVFQTSATGMAPESIARDFGGRIAFYGGIDCQQLLTFGTPAEVAREVHRNLTAFADCGGYVVANSHHCLANIQGANIVAMCVAAHTASPPP